MAVFTRPKNGARLILLTTLLLLIAGAVYLTTDSEAVTNGNNSTTAVIKPTAPVVWTQPLNLSQLPEDKEAELSLSPKKALVTHLSLKGDRLVQLLGEVRENALDAATKITQLASESTSPIYLLLSGPGGSIVTGAKVIAAIQGSRAPVYTICDVMCASMDAMIHQYGKKRYITDRTIMMFHPAAGGTDGDLDRMYTMAKFLKRYVNKMEWDVSKRQGISFEEYKAKTQVNLWIDAEDSLAAGISDGTVTYTVSGGGFGAILSQSSNKTKAVPPQPVKVTPPARNFDIQWICKECMENKLWLTK